MAEIGTAYTLPKAIRIAHAVLEKRIAQEPEPEQLKPENDE